MAVGTAVRRFPRKMSREYSGEFTGVNNSNPTGVAFKGEVTVTRSGEGLYLVTPVEGKGCRIASVDMTFVAPANADGGSGAWFIQTDSMASAGTFILQTNNLAGAAADVLVLTKLAFVLEREAA